MSYTFQLCVSRGDVHHVHYLLLLAQRTLQFRLLSSSSKISHSLKESYRRLQLPEDGRSSPAQVREAYLQMAKLYHPDSGAATADAALFAQVEQAYRAILAHQSQVKRNHVAGEEGEDDEKTISVAPQHRHYLSYEGIGLGTPSQRERQYRQFRVDRATEGVLNYRQMVHEKAAAEEGALVDRDLRQRSRKIKITQAVERLVEDLIQESMARGDFQNLSGAGKPLDKFQHNPYADPMTHNLNRILIDNGYQPAWIVAQRDIRETTGQIRSRLLEGRARLGDPMTARERAQWEQLCASVEEELSKLNKMVDNLNLIVPMLKMQRVHFSMAREVDRAEKGARQHREKAREDREKAREREREQRKERTDGSRTKNTKQGLISWMQSLLRDCTNGTKCTDPKQEKQSSSQL